MKQLIREYISERILQKIKEKYLGKVFKDGVERVKIVNINQLLDKLDSQDWVEIDVDMNTTYLPNDIADEIERQFNNYFGIRTIIYIRDSYPDRKFPKDYWD